MRIQLILGIAFIGAGILHFIYPRAYGAFLPTWLPLKNALVLGSGLAEIGVGAALFFDPTAAIGALGLFILMLCFLPLHAYHVFDPPAKLSLPSWVYFVRLVMQVAFVYGSWVFYVGLRAK